MYQYPPNLFLPVPIRPRLGSSYRLQSYADRNSCWLCSCTIYSVALSHAGISKWTSGAITDCQLVGMPAANKESTFPLLNPCHSVCPFKRWFFFAESSSLYPAHVMSKAVLGQPAAKRPASMNFCIQQRDSIVAHKKVLPTIATGLLIHSKFTVWDLYLDFYVSIGMIWMRIVIICGFSFVSYKTLWTIKNQYSMLIPLSSTIWPIKHTDINPTPTMNEVPRWSKPLTSLAGFPFKSVDMTRAMVPNIPL